MYRLLNMTRRRNIVSIVLLVLLYPLLSSSCSGSDKVDSSYVFESQPRRVALVVGNSDYDHQVSIPSASLDAQQMENSLKALGFDVLVYHNVSMRQFEYDLVPEFAKKIQPGDLAVFFFSGHGFAYGANNFLAPTDLPQSIDEQDVTLKAFSVEAFEDSLKAANPELVVFLLDSCRSMPNFVVKDANNNNVVEKGFKEAQQPQRSHYNTIFGYAARFGNAAIGSSAPGQMSLYSSGLIQYLTEQDAELDDVLKDVRSYVLRHSQQRQDPGIGLWSATDLYLNPTPTILDQEKIAWLSALSSNKSDAVEHFSERYALCPFAAAARKWLKDHPQQIAVEAYSMVSPVAVERAWRPDNSKRVALRRLGAPLALGRKADVTQEGVAGLSDKQLGLLPSGTLRSDIEAPSVSLTASTQEVSFDYALVSAVGSAVTTADLKGRVEPKVHSPVAEQIPFGTPITITGVESGAANDKWLAAENPRTKTKFFLPADPVAPPRPLELGQSLREVTVPGIQKGLEDLVDPMPIVASIAALRSTNRRITWVSIAAGRGKDQEEDDTLAARVIHAEYILTQNGIPRERITTVQGERKIKGDKIRVRFFGYTKRR